MPAKRALCHGFERWLQAIKALSQTGAELRVFGPPGTEVRLLHILLLQSFAKLLAGEILPARSA